MPVPPRLTEEDYKIAAALLACEVAAIKAVAEVESRGDGFLQDGRPRILFEGHIFHKYTNGQFAQSNPTLCYPKFTKQFYCTGTAEQRGQGELKRFDTASALDPSAAKKSCSIGKFQVMGFNFKICGFNSVDEFWDALSRDEGEQLKAFCKFVQGNRLDRHLRTHDWTSFAFRYNGESYKANKYDTKMAESYSKYAQLG